MEEEKVYGYKIRCKNCGLIDIVNIKMGVSVDEFVTERVKDCERCGLCDWEGVEAI